VVLLAPLVQNRKGEHRDLLVDAQSRGFARARVDGKVKGWRRRSSWTRKSKHTWSW